MGMLETRCGCCVALYCGALAEAGWRVSWWRVRVPACAGAIGGVSMGVRSSRAAERHTDGGREYISPTLHTSVWQWQMCMRRPGEGGQMRTVYG